AAEADDDVAVPALAPAAVPAGIARGLRVVGVAFDSRERVVVVHLLDDADVVAVLDRLRARPVVEDDVARADGAVAADPLAGVLVGLGVAGHPGVALLVPAQRVRAYLRRGQHVGDEHVAPLVLESVPLAE